MPCYISGLLFFHGLLILMYVCVLSVLKAVASVSICMYLILSIWFQHDPHPPNMSL